jgi:hypothetical protein
MIHAPFGTRILSQMFIASHPIVQTVQIVEVVQDVKSAHSL